MRKVFEKCSKYRTAKLVKLLNLLSLPFLCFEGLEFDQLSDVSIDQAGVVSLGVFKKNQKFLMGISMSKLKMAKKCSKIYTKIEVKFS